MRRKVSFLLVLSLVMALLLPGCGGEPETLDNGNFTKWLSGLGEQESKVHTYKITEDITLTEEILIDGHDVTLELDGHKISGEKIRAFSLTGGAALTLKGGTVETKGFDGDGGIIHMDSSDLILDNMTLSNIGDSHVSERLSGGVIYATGKESGSVTLKGGTVVNGSASGLRRCGGAITMNGATVLEIEDATVQGGKAGTAGNIQLEGTSVLNLRGGTITGGTALHNTEIAGSGGNIGGQALSQIHVYSGTISEGTAERTGGNIYLSNTAGEQSGLHLYGGTIEKGTAETEGGNIYATEKYSLIRIYGGDIADGNAVRGGNIGMQKATLDLWGGKLAGLNDNTLLISGGNIFAEAATLNIHGGEIAYGFAQDYGGNIHLKEGNLNIYGGKIYSGTLSVAEVGKGGGNIYATGASLVNIYGGEIYGGVTNCQQLQEPSGAGPNVMIGGTTLLQMFGGEIRDGMTYGEVTRGGGVYVYGQAKRTNPVFYMYGGVIENGAMEGKMRGMCVASYSETKDNSGIALTRIFGGELRYTGPDDSNKVYAIYGNKTKGTDLYLYTFEQYPGLYSRTTAKPCPDETHNTVTGELAPTCNTQGAVIHECGTCGTWYEITAQPLGHKDTVDGNRHSCSECDATWYE